MTDYWRKRHADALARAANAPTPALRAIYLQLAAHYRLMFRDGGDVDKGD